MRLQKTYNFAVAELYGQKMNLEVSNKNNCFDDVPFYQEIKYLLPLPLPLPLPLSISFPLSPSPFLLPLSPFPSSSHSHSSLFPLSSSPLPSPSPFSPSPPSPSLFHLFLVTLCPTLRLFALPLSFPCSSWFLHLLPFYVSF